MLLTSQPFYFEFTRRYFAFQVDYEFLETLLLLLRECNVRGTYFRALEDDEQGVSHDETTVEHTVFRSLRSTSSFLRYASPTSPHVLEHTPGSSSDPSQHSASAMRLGCGNLVAKHITYHKDHPAHVNWG